jgi:ABC-type transporter Mla subunit MlaD
VATRQEKVSAGLFLLTGVLLLSALVALIAGLRLRGAQKEYLIRFTESVGRLTRGATVSYYGYEVGEVRDVDPDPAEVGVVNVTLQVKEGIPIKTGTYAILESNFLTSETTIELRGGDSAEADLKEGSEIPYRTPPLKALEESLPQAMADVLEVAHRLQELLDQENRDAVARILARLEELVATASDSLIQVREEAGRFREVAESFSGSTQQELRRVSSDISRTVDRGSDAVTRVADGVTGAADSVRMVGGDLSRAATEFAELTERLQRTTDHLDGTLEGTQLLLDENRERVARTLQDLTAAARSLRNLAQDLENNPSALLRIQPKEEHERGD